MYPWSQGEGGGHLYQTTGIKGGKRDSPEDNLDLIQKEGETMLDAQYTRWVLWSFRSPPIPLSHCHTPAFAIPFCWSELSAEIQVTHCFLEQVPGDTVSLFLRLDMNAQNCLWLGATIRN